MKKKLIILFILALTRSLFADEKILNEFTSKINEENSWIPIEYLDVINSKNRDTLKNIIPDYNYERFYDPFCEEWFEWYEKYTIENLFFDDYIGLDGKRYKFIFFDNEWFYSIKKIESNLYVLLHQEPGSILNINTKFSQIGKISPLESLRKTPLYSEDPTYYDDEEYKFDEIIIDARFIFGGDYLTVYANEDKFRQVYFKCTEETYEQLKSLIYTNTIDFSKVTWPRHADGSCDYDGSKTTSALTANTTASTNVEKNKIMSVAEKLKLRSGEATSTQVLSVMSAGTKVKILELGKEETIDGIKSNWVKVEIISGNDRDGNKLKSGMTGWCYGGYLE